MRSSVKPRSIARQSTSLQERSDRMRTRTPSALLVTLLAIEVTPAFAQSSPLVERNRMTSTVLNEAREYDVYVPPGYGETTRPFPVLYVLDADQLFLTAVAAAQMLEDAGAMPPTIVIGVRNTNRERDFTTVATHPDAVPRGVGPTGGVVTFARFLREELIPQIDQRYRTAPSRTLVGHSLGGLAAMHVLATAPTTFRSYVTLEPSLWWDRRAVADSVIRSLGTRALRKENLIAVERGTDDGWRPDSARLVAAFRSASAVTFVHVSGVTHQQLPYRGLYDGLAALFRGYPSVAVVDPSKASVLALTAQYATLSEQFGYDIEIPLAALLDAAQRRLDARSARDAVEILTYAAAKYPRDPRVPARLAEAQRELTTPSARRYVAFVPVTAQVAATFVGSWEESVAAVGSAPPQRVRHTFSLHGDSLMHAAVVYLTADSTQKFAIAPMPVAVRGDTLSWERVNRAGGSYVTRVVRGRDNELRGEERGLGLPTPPPGVVNRPVPVRLVKAR